MLVASVSPFILGKVVQFREVSIWPWVFDCFPRVAAHREARSVYFSFSESQRGSLFWQRDLSTCHLKCADITDCCKPTPQFCVTGSRRSEAARAGMREVKPSCVSGAGWGSWWVPPHPGQESPSLRWAGEQGANRQMEHVLHLRGAPPGSRNNAFALPLNE